MSTHTQKPWSNRSRRLPAEPADNAPDTSAPPLDGRPSAGRLPRVRRVRAMGLAGLSLLAVLAVAHVVAPSRSLWSGTPATSPAPTVAASAAVGTSTPAPAPGSALAVSASADEQVAPPAVALAGIASSPLRRPPSPAVSGTPSRVRPAGNPPSPADDLLLLAASAPLAAATGPTAAATPAGAAPMTATAAATAPGASQVLDARAMAALPIRAAAAAPAITTSHPRMILDSATLTVLRQRAAANTAEWQLLKSTCDAYIGGTVNYPNQNAYPGRPNLGSGYQGESYLPALLAEGMCYQVLKSSDPTAAAAYGAKAVDILMKMSAPYTGSGSQGQNPCTDAGYGIRYFGVGYGLGYDWVYELLTPSQRTQVYTTANAWLTAWEDPNPSACANFEYVHPHSNYFAGYFHAKAAIALGTYGENPNAAAQWDDWYNNQFGTRVQPYYAQHLLGGGWPEGYGNYAPLAILNMSLPVREVKTATGVDLVHAASPYSFPLDSADYAMHFTWPSRAYFDDRDTNHASGTANPPVGTVPVGMFEHILGEMTYWGSSKVGVFHQYLNEVSAATSGFSPAAPWLLFLETDPAAPTTAVNTLPLSYLAPGLGAVAARSDWGTGASWMSFRAGPYVNNPAQGEEGFDKGSLALVRGNTPLLVNTFGWMVHEPNGASDENILYNDLLGSFNNTLYFGNRQIYNVYYVRNMSGSTVVDRFGQAAYTTEDNQVRTKVSAYEDGTDYVYVQSTNLEDMYRKFPAGPAVAAWSRQIVYLRPNRFVVYDRTTSGSAGYDQYMAWHFPANPVAGTAATGQKRLDVTYNGQYVGAMTTLLPANATTTTVPLYPSSNPVKVWQVQVRAPDTNVAQRWMTVFDLSTSASAVAAISPVTITQGGIVGAWIAASDGNSAVINSTGAAGTAISGTVAYTVPAAAHHVVTELARATGYNITVTTGAGGQTVSISPGGTYMTSGKGVLNFFVGANGAIKEGGGIISRLPVSTLPVNGSPRPYKP